MAGFFGYAQLLMREGVATQEQIVRALDLMDAENRALGRIAIDENLISHFDAERVAQVQRRSDRPFGQIAVDLGLLSAQDVDRLLEEQRRTNLSLLAALVRLGHLDEAQGELLEARFTDEHARYEPVPLAVPAELSGSPLACSFLAALPRSLMRIARLEVEVREGASGSNACDHKASIQLLGRGELRVGLLADDGFGRCVAMGALGFAPEELEPELIEDGLAEFLGVVASNAVAVLPDSDARIEAPEPAVAVRSGVGFRIQALRGEATLYLLLAAKGAPPRAGEL